MCPDYLHSKCNEGTTSLPAGLDPYGEPKALPGSVRLHEIMC